MDEGIGSYPGRSWTSFVLLEAKKSADAIVVAGNEPRKETVEASQSNEGLNVRFVHNSIRKLLGLTQSSLILNKDRRLFGAKSEKLIPGEPRCIRDPYSLSRLAHYGSVRGALVPILRDQPSTRLCGVIFLLFYSLGPFVHAVFWLFQSHNPEFFDRK